MVIPELRALTSPDLSRDTLPQDPEDCTVLIEAEIGPQGESGGDVFSFTFITPPALMRDSVARWGRGYFIATRFSWETAERAISKLLLHSHRSTWSEVAAELGKEMRWEFEGYAPR